MSSSTLIETVAVLDGRLVIEGWIGARWGAVVMQLVPDVPSRPAAGARIATIRALADARDGLALGNGPRIVHDPRLFVAIIASVAARGAHVRCLPLHGALVRASHAPAANPDIPSRGWLDEVRGVLHERFDRAIRLIDVAQAVGIEPVRVSRGFSAHYGMTMSRYVRDLRVMRAGELLLRTSQPLSAIAMSSGFVDHVHLARAFRTCIGVCPTDLRRQVHGRQVA